MKSNNVIYLHRSKIKKTQQKKNVTYNCIFQCPINFNDCINSIAIHEDKVVFGTLMGDVYLCRVDENNLSRKNSQNNFIKKENNNSELSLNKTQNLENDESNIKLNNNNQNKKCDYIKLTIDNNTKENKDEDIEDYNDNEDNNKDKDDEDNNDKIFKKKKKNKNLKINNNDNCDNNENKNFTNENNIDDEDENSNKYEKKLINKNMGKVQSHKGGKNIKIDKLDSKLFNEKKEKKGDTKYNSHIKFPQVTKLINRSKENIPCLEFENYDIINISIGDLEVLRLENMSTFNINDQTSTYNYFKLRNYKTENDHIEFCETCTCMMSNSYYLIVFTKLGNFNSILEIRDIKYENKDLKKLNIVKGSIKMSNYAVPFDFDGDQFLFLDYLSKDERIITVVYTLSKKEDYYFIIEDKSYGHISHMKLLPNNKIFLCRRNKECEIHLMNKDFDIIEKWEHIGEDVISCCIFKNENINNINKNNYFELIDDNEEEFTNDEEKNKKGWSLNIFKLFGNNANNKNNRNDLNSKRSILNSNKTINIKPFQSNIDSENNKNNNIKNISKNKAEKNLISSNEVNNYIHTENYNVPFKKKNLILNNIQSLNPSIDNSSRREINFTIENKKFTSNRNSNSASKNQILITSGKKNRNSNKNSISSIEIYGRKKNQIYSKKGIDKSSPLNGSDFGENEEEQTIAHNKENEMNFSIVTLDKDGSVNVFYNKKQKTLFNIYNISNIDDKYKKMEFFSVGFPYYILVNELYFCITTDHGLFVISKNND